MERWLEAMSKSEEVRFLTDAIPGFISYLDTEKRYRFVNRRYSEHFDLRSEDVLGRTPKEIWGQDVSRMVDPFLDRALAGETFTVEVPFGGGMNLNSYISHQSNGEVQGLLIVSQDISELSEARSAVIQSEVQASLGRLVAGLLHEINTPIGVLNSSLSTVTKALKAGKEPAKVLPLLEAAQSATQRLAAMSGSLRAFAQLDASNLNMYDLTVGIESALALLEVGPNIEVQLRCDALPQVYCKPAEINQVMYALLSNAVNAIEGAGIIEVVGRVDEEVHVDVIDSGRGIDPARISTLFEPSFAKGKRVKASLGLFVSRGIANRHGGEIKVESELGRGSRFTLSLPRHKRDET